jgi:hypothetical protein
MRAIAEFVKTTLIGGLLIVLPVYIAVLGRVLWSDRQCAKRSVSSARRKGGRTAR